MGEFYDVVLQLVLSGVVGGLIGLERERNHRPAGLRTHILVTMGSCLIMQVSKNGFADASNQARLAAQVVSGVGFLGTGTILRTGNDVKGLTTAATIWVASGIGLAIGNGYYIGGFSAAIGVLFTLVSLGFIEDVIGGTKKKTKMLVVHTSKNELIMGYITKLFQNSNIKLHNVNMEDIAEGEVCIYFEIYNYSEKNYNLLHTSIAMLPYVHNVEIRSIPSKASENKRPPCSVAMRKW